MNGNPNVFRLTGPTLDNGVYTLQQYSFSSSFNPDTCTIACMKEYSISVSGTTITATPKSSNLPSGCICPNFAVTNGVSIFYGSTMVGTLQRETRSDSTNFVLKWEIWSNNVYQYDIGTVTYGKQTVSSGVKLNFFMMFSILSVLVSTIVFV